MNILLKWIFYWFIYKNFNIIINNLNCYNEYEIDYKNLKIYFLEKYKKQINFIEKNKFDINKYCLIYIEINNIIVEFFNDYPFNEFNFYKWVLNYLKYLKKDVEIIPYKEVNYFSIIVYNNKNELINFIKEFVKKYKIQPIIMLKKEEKYKDKNIIGININKKINNLVINYDEKELYFKIKDYFFSVFNKKKNIINYDLKYLYLFNDFNYNFIFYSNELYLEKEILKDNFISIFIKTTPDIKKLFSYLDFSKKINSYEMMNINSNILKGVKNEQGQELTENIFIEDYEFDYLLFIFDKINQTIEQFIKYFLIINKNKRNKLKIIIRKNNYLLKLFSCNKDYCFYYSNNLDRKKNKLNKFKLIDKTLENFEEVKDFLEKNSNYKLFDLIKDDKYNYELDLYL